MRSGSPSVSLAVRDRELLVAWSRSRTLAMRVVLRSRILLMLAGGAGVAVVAKTLNVSPTTVRLWKRRYEVAGASSLLADAPGRGRKPVLNAAVRAALRAGHQNGDAVGVRQRARELGVSPATVSRWRRRDA